MKRRLLVVALALAALVAVLRYADLSTLWAALVDMPRWSLLVLVGLLAVGSVVKAVRWAFYLRSAELDIAWRSGMTSYLAGMAATALPGGSLLAARLAQEHGDVKMRQAAPAIFVSMVADTIAVSALALGVTALTDQQGNRFVIPVIGLLLAAVFIAMGRSSRVWHAVDRLLARFPVTRGWLPKEADIHARVEAMMRRNVLVRGVGLSVVTTLISIGFLYVAVNALTFRGIRVMEAAVVHTTAETVGAVVPLSIGLSVGDSSLAGLLNSLGIGWVRVVFIVLVMRSMNIIFRTMLGAVVLVVCYRGLLRSTLALERRTRGVRRHAWRAGKRVSRGPLRVTRAFGLFHPRHRPARETVMVTPTQASTADGAPAATFAPPGSTDD